MIEDVPILVKYGISIDDLKYNVHFQLSEHDSYKPSYKGWDLNIKESEFYKLKSIFNEDLLREIVANKDKYESRKVEIGEKEFNISYNYSKETYYIRISYRFAEQSYLNREE